MTETIRVELHCHSSLSDGDHSPAYVAHSVAATGVEWASLTDHNTLSGQHQFRTVLEKRGVHTLVGVEMDARSPTGVIHLLGYGLNPENQQLLDALSRIRQPLRSSARYWASRLASATDRQTRRQEYEATHRREPRLPGPPSTADAIRLMHNAGGLVCLAHPMAGLGSLKNLEALLEWLKPEGLDGMEVFHKPYPKEMQQALLAVATRRRLLCVAGSDFHGIYHSDGASPGVDMPLVHWKQFLSALDRSAVKSPPSVSMDPLVS